MIFKDKKEIISLLDWIKDSKHEKLEGYWLWRGSIIMTSEQLLSLFENCNK